MGALEDALRDTFADRVALPPALEDTAGRAIEQAGRQRRRQAVMGVVAIIVAVVVTSGGALVFANGAQPAEGPAAAPTSSATPHHAPVAVVPSGPPPTDVLVGDSIVTTTGRVITLTQVVGGQPRREPVAAYRAPGSWLVRVTDALGGEELWRVWANGSVAYVLKGQSIVVAPDGIRVAWQEGGRVHSGKLDGNGWVGQRSVEVGAATRLTGFAVRSVILQGADGGHEQWFPTGGSRGVQAATPPAKVYGGTPGATILGLTRGPGGQVRLAEYSWNGMALVRTGGVVQEPDWTAAGSVSPDGRWLLTVGRGTVRLYDLTRAWDQPDVPAAVSWSTEATNALWLADGSVAVGGPNVVSVHRVDGSTVGSTEFRSDRRLPTTVIAPLG